MSASQDDWRPLEELLGARGTCGGSPTLDNAMRALTIHLDEPTYTTLVELARRQGVGPERAAEALLAAGAQELAKAHATLERLLARASEVPEDEATRIAREEVAAMRAERRAGRL